MQCHRINILSKQQENQTRIWCDQLIEFVGWCRRVEKEGEREGMARDNDREKEGMARDKDRRKEDDRRRKSEAKVTFLKQY